MAARNSPSSGWRARSSRITCSMSCVLRADSGWMKLEEKLTITTPRFAAMARRRSSGRLRGCSARAKAELWEAMIGAWDTRRASSTVSRETWETSTSIPRRFISRTTSSPKGLSPPCLGASVDESAQAVVSEWVSVM